MTAFTGMKTKIIATDINAGEVTEEIWTVDEATPRATLLIRYRESMAAMGRVVINAKDSERGGFVVTSRPDPNTWGVCAWCKGTRVLTESGVCFTCKSRGRS